MKSRHREADDYMPRDHFKPARRTVRSDASDPHFAGWMVVELTPDAIRWWWEGREQDAVPDGRVTFGELAQSTFLNDVVNLEMELAGARTRLASVAELVARLQKLTAFKVIGDARSGT